MIFKVIKVLSFTKKVKVEFMLSAARIFWDIKSARRLKVRKDSPEENAREPFWTFQKVTLHFAFDW